MNINTETMTEVSDVNNRQRTPDLQYSQTTEKWTINSSVQDILNLDDSHGFKLSTAETYDGESVILLEVVPSEETTFFTGKGSVFTGRKMWTLVESLLDGETSLAMEPVSNEENLYVLQPWNGQSMITQTIVSPSVSETFPSEDDSLEEQEVDNTQLEKKELEPSFSL